MRYVLDASVAVAGLRKNEPNHVRARARLQRILEGEDEIVAPALFVAEVGSALARRGWEMRHVTRALTMLVPDAALVTIGPRAAGRIARLAVAAKLRAADAAYAWVAVRHGLPLCTLDHELAERASGHCETFAP